MESQRIFGGTEILAAIRQFWDESVRLGCDLFIPKNEPRVEGSGTDNVETLQFPAAVWAGALLYQTDRG